VILLRDISTEMLGMLILGVSLKKGILKWRVWKDGKTVIFRQDISVKDDTLKNLFKEMVRINFPKINFDIISVGKKIEIERNTDFDIVKIEFDTIEEAHEFFNELKNEVDRFTNVLILIADKFEEIFRKTIQSIARMSVKEPLLSESPQTSMNSSSSEEGSSTSSSNSSSSDSS